MEILDSKINIYLSPEEEDWELFIGPNAEYYLPIWRKFKNQDTKVHIHIPALLLNIYWLGYRKMYKYVFICILASQIMPVIIGALMNQEDLYLQTLFLTMSIYPILGLVGNWIYYNNAQKIIQKIKHTHQTKQDRNKALEEAGRVNPSFPFLMLFFSFFIGISVSSILGFILA